MCFVDKAVQIGAEIRCRRLAVVLRHLRATHTDHACPHGGIVHRRHVGHHAALAAAGQVKLGLVHAELQPLCAREIDRVDICHIAVRLAVRLVKLPFAVFRLEEKQDQLFLSLLGIRDHTPTALTPQVIRCLAVLRQNKHTCRRGARPLRDIQQIPARFAADLNGFLERALIQGLEGILWVHLAMIILIHFRSPSFTLPA